MFKGNRVYKSILIFCHRGWQQLQFILVNY